MKKKKNLTKFYNYDPLFSKVTKKRSNKNPTFFPVNEKNEAFFSKPKSSNLQTNRTKYTILPETQLASNQILNHR